MAELACFENHTKVENYSHTTETDLMIRIVGSSWYNRKSEPARLEIVMLPTKVKIIYLGKLPTALVTKVEWIQ